MKRKTLWISFFLVFLAVSLLASGCVLGEQATIYKTTTRTETQLATTTVVKTQTVTIVNQQPSSPVTVTSFITTTVPVATTAPLPLPTTVYLTTTAVQQGIHVKQIDLPAEEIPAGRSFSICILVENVSVLDMDCRIPVTINQHEDEDYKLVRYLDFYIRGGEAKTVCVDYMKLSSGSYTVQAVNNSREFYIIAGTGG